MAELELHPHPDYGRLAKRAAWLRLVLSGGYEFKLGKDDHGYETLPRYQGEDSAAHVRRVAATPVPKIAAEYVRQRRDDVMRSKIVRPQLDEDGSDQLAAWAKDVDHAGRSLSTFMGDVLHEGLVGQFAWFGVDAPTSEELAGLTAADPGAWPYAVTVPLEDVLDWDVDGGSVVRVAILYRRTSKEGLTSKPTTSRYVVEWLPEVVRRYEVDEEATARAPDSRSVGVGCLKLKEPEESPHEFGLVPWRRAEPIKGESFAERFAELQRSATQTRSDMIAEQKANTYTLKVFWGVDTAELQKAAGDAANGLAFGNAPDGRLDRVGGDPAVMQELRANLAADLDEARRRSELTGAVLERSSQPESGVALSLRRSELASLRASIAEQTEQDENWLIRTWAEAAGMDERAEEMAVSRYPRDFDGFAETERDDRLEALRSDRSVPIEVRRGALKEQVMRLWPQDSKERDAMLEAVEAMQEGLARQLLGGPPPPPGEGASPARPFGRPEPVEERATN